MKLPPITVLFCFLALLVPEGRAAKKAKLNVDVGSSRVSLFTSEGSSIVYDKKTNVIAVVDKPKHVALVINAATNKGAILDLKTRKKGSGSDAGITVAIKSRANRDGSEEAGGGVVIGFRQLDNNKDWQKYDNEIDCVEVSITESESYCEDGDSGAVTATTTEWSDSGSNTEKPTSEYSSESNSEASDSETTTEKHDSVSSSDSNSGAFDSESTTKNHDSESSTDSNSGGSDNESTTEHEIDTDSPEIVTTEFEFTVTWPSDEEVPNPDFTEIQWSMTVFKQIFAVIIKGELELSLISISSKISTVVFDILASVNVHITTGTNNVLLVLQEISNLFEYLIKLAGCKCSLIGPGMQNIDFDILELWRASRIVQITIGVLIPIGTTEIDPFKYLRKSIAEIIIDIVVKNDLQFGKLSDFIKLIASISSDINIAAAIDVIIARAIILKQPNKENVIAFVTILINYVFQDPTDGPSIKVSIKNIIKILERIKNKHKFAKIILEYIKRTSFVNKLIKLLIQSSKFSPLQLIIKILVAIKKKISLQKTIPTLVIELIYFVTARKIHLLRLLFPRIPKKIDISAIVKGLVKLEAVTLRDLKLNIILKHILKGIQDALKKLKVKIKFSNLFIECVVENVVKYIRQVAKKLASKLNKD